MALRRTDQALLQLICEAEYSLYLVSFAVCKAQTIVEALRDAAQRGVKIQLYLEAPSSSDDKITCDTIRALGNDIHRYAQIYVWPLAQRVQSPDGKHGSPHAKVAIADSKSAFVSSANLTDYAMELNIEVGVVVHGGEVPGQIESYLSDLVDQGIFWTISPHANP